MIEGKVERAFNEQLKNELGSAYLYLSMAAYFHSLGLHGMAQWMRVQTQEETLHAMKFFDHIKDRGGRVKLAALAEPKPEWSSPLDAFRHAYKHEQFVTSKINELVKVAEGEDDQAAKTFLQWFVAEQVEEETSASKVVHMLERVGDSREGLLMVDGELGARTFTVPTTAEGEGI